MKNSNVKVNISGPERIVLNYAIDYCNGEIKEPANDDKVIMDVLVSLYNKNLINIDLNNDKLFVNNIGRGLLCL